MQRTAQNGTHQRADGVDPETRAKGRNSPPCHRSDEPRPEVAGGVHSAPVEWRDGHDESGHCGADECRTSVRRDLLATEWECTRLIWASRSGVFRFQFE